MNTLTLDQAKKIIQSAPNSYKASVALSNAGFVVGKLTDSYTLMVDGHEIIFHDSPVFKCIYISVDGVLVRPSYFLEPQQQNTSVVPANEQTQPSVALVACAAEARPNFDPLVVREPFDCPKCKTTQCVLGVHLHGLVTINCPECHHYDESLISFMAETFFSQLSTETVDK